MKYVKKIEKICSVRSSFIRLVFSRNHEQTVHYGLKLLKPTDRKLSKKTNRETKPMTGLSGFTV
ncbi:hypothetical protein HanRHA438_Chr09g0430251 [Helianthus annuus]|nr:hypothetical protein HanRHA438_Chr09g0430251 [Helianthus annuus]